MEKRTLPGVNPGRVTVGLIVLAVGLLMLVDRANDFGVSATQLFPGMVLIGMGLGRMALAQIETAAEKRSDTLRHSLWLMTVGSWLIVNGLHLFGLTYRTSWPLLLMASGVFIVARGWGK
jgi:hypothetical protein